MAESDDLDRLLPKCWPKFVRRALVLACSMLKAAFDIEVGRRLDCNLHHTREHAAHQRLRLDCSTEREVPQLIRSRFERLAPRKRPYYARAERLRILELKALNGWTAAEAADRMLVDEDTICRWIKELIQVGEERLLAVEPPANKFPRFVDRIVAQMVVVLPVPTRRKIATISGAAPWTWAASTSRAEATAIVAFIGTLLDTRARERPFL